ncbi:hypothetical protein N7510_006486 [Penicillium lagena]|uniref:uncharacterized protein n=1 Tax=Penicillium lagena TaxID=94218 RepID=UPI0025414DC2|nr:uncharacterized protein N7510_006486 [Penicillium lagena]KAJ5613292.1 hypothetical protein N7510_006486 [Penicillium lagena]
MREPRNLEVRVSQLGTGAVPVKHTSWAFQAAIMVPQITEDEPGNDTDLAGIIRSRPSRIHRLWSRPLSADGRENTHLSAGAPEARHKAHRSILRRLARRPPFGKSQSLFVMPTTLAAGNKVLIPGWMPTRMSARPFAIREKQQITLSADTTRMVHGKRHRRCHSEQPRSWREPSASLWALREE